MNLLATIVCTSANVLVSAVLVSFTTWKLCRNHGKYYDDIKDTLTKNGTCLLCCTCIGFVGLISCILHYQCFTLFSQNKLVETANSVESLLFQYLLVMCIWLIIHPLYAINTLRKFNYTFKHSIFELRQKYVYGIFVISFIFLIGTMFLCIYYYFSINYNINSDGINGNKVNKSIRNFYICSLCCVIIYDIYNTIIVSTIVYQSRKITQVLFGYFERSIEEPPSQHSTYLREKCQNIVENQKLWIELLLKHNQQIKKELIGLYHDSHADDDHGDDEKTGHADADDDCSISTDNNSNNTNNEMIANRFLIDSLPIALWLIIVDFALPYQNEQELEMLVDEIMNQSPNNEDINILPAGRLTIIPKCTLANYLLKAQKDWSVEKYTSYIHQLVTRFYFSTNIDDSNNFSTHLPRPGESLRSSIRFAIPIHHATNLSSNHITHTGNINTVNTIHSINMNAHRSRLPIHRLRMSTTERQKRVILTTSKQYYLGFISTVFHVICIIVNLVFILTVIIHVKSIKQMSIYCCYYLTMVAFVILIDLLCLIGINVSVAQKIFGNVSTRKR